MWKPLSYLADMQSMTPLGYPIGSNPGEYCLFFKVQKFFFVMLENLKTLIFCLIEVLIDLTLLLPWINNWFSEGLSK